MASTARPHPSADRRIPWAVDLLLAVLLLAVDAAVAFYGFLGAGLAAWSDAVDGEDRGPDPGPVIVFGVVTVIVGLSAFALARGRLPLSAVAQCLATLALLGGTLLVWSSEYRTAHPDPAPGSDPGYSGT